MSIRDRIRLRTRLGRRNGPSVEIQDGSFDAHVFAAIREGSRRSASVVVPVVQEIVRARSIVDVGGGEGWWAAEFARLGVRAVCVDDGALGEPAPGVEHVRQDLRQGMPPGLGTFDLAVCLEVAEHIDAPSGDRLIEALCDLAPAVLFSAAVPGQDGHGHENEQWPAYWIERFERAGFACSGALRWRFWGDDRVETWYRQNLLFAMREPTGAPELFETPLAEPWPVVHPDTFARIVSQL